MKNSFALALSLAALGASLTTHSQTADLWDLSQGTVITATSGPIPGYAMESIFDDGPGGGGGEAYFADNQSPGFVHFVEWQTPADVTIAHLQMVAFGDGIFGFTNNEREFSHLTVRAKSPGSSTYDITILDFDATHPYTYDGGFPVLLDRDVPATTASSFRAEFTQYEGGLGFDGPRIVEFNAFGPKPPIITAQPQSAFVNYGMPVQFKVNATGTGALAYQWYKDGTAISGKTAAVFRIPSVTQNDQAAYTVAVTDSIGTTMSLPATIGLNFFNVVQSDADVWDVNAGAVITAESPVLPADGSPAGLFGGNSVLSEGYLTYFADGMPTGTVHSVEWTTASPVTVNSIRLFAHGDPFLNNGREFEKLTIKAKSAGSSTFNVVVATFTPTHPYSFLDSDLILDTRITPILTSAFRAEFLQRTAGYGFDGPRIIELDGFEGRPLLRPVVVTGPDSKTVPKNSFVTWKVVVRGGDLTYQWKFKGQNINGATTDTLQLKHVKAKDQGYYTVVVSNAVGSVESPQALLLITP